MKGTCFEDPEAVLLSEGTGLVLLSTIIHICVSLSTHTLSIIVHISLKLISEMAKNL